jgi:hypothetical protein
MKKSVVVCWLCWSTFHVIVGYRCDLDFVVGIDFSKDNDWVPPMLQDLGKIGS